MKVLRSKVVELCEALGFKTASKWNRVKMEEKLKTIADTVKADEVEISDDGLKDLLVALIAQGGEVEVVVKEEEMTEDGTTDGNEATEEEQAEQTEPSGPATCSNCGATEFDEDGDCAKCHEPAAKKSKVKKDKKPKAKKERKQRTDGEKSNKQVVYELWMEDNNTAADTAFKAVDGAVQITTIKGWMNQWKHGKNLPGCAKKTN